jgi:hypothetical protein
MKEYQQRVVEEKQQLDARRDRLMAFMARNPSFYNLPYDERDRLRRQYHVMGLYAEILGQRIAVFQ